MSINQSMDSKNQMSSIAYHNTFFPARLIDENSIVLEFRKESIEIDHDSIANDILTSLTDHSRGQQMKVILFAIGNNRVASIVST